MTIVDLRKGDQAVPTVLDAKGDYPSWNPAGSQIFIGGTIVQSDGTLVDRLVGNVKAVGNWSPDGTRLAVVADGEVRLFEGFRPETLTPDRIPDDLLSGGKGRFRSLLLAGAWTAARDLPAPQGDTFMAQWQRRSKP